VSKRLRISSLLREQRAFSLLEMIITMSISVVVFLGVSELSNMIVKQMSNLQVNAALIEDNALMRKVVIRDLLHSGPSYNYFIRNDFQVMGDNPPATITNFWQIYGKNESAFSAEVTLDQAGDSFYILKSDYTDYNGDKKGVHFVNPVDVSNDSGTLNTTKLRDELSAVWEVGSYLKFKALTQIDGRDYALLIKIDSGASNTDNYCGQEDFVCMAPSTLRCSVSTIANLQEYLGCLPVQGAFANVLVSPVELVGYELREPPRAMEPGFRLYRIARGREQLIATRMRWISFSRNDLSDTIINVASRFYKVLEGNKDRSRRYESQDE
jgi:prepilin-type N-terminal cleavage/methylation domain-containing protein